MPIDLSPLLRGATGAGLRVAGVALGEPAVNVDRSVLTGADEAQPVEARIYADGVVYREGPGGLRTEVPLAERVDAVLARGGWLRVERVALRVDVRGAVDSIFVRGPALAELGIAREEDIVARFGPPAGHQLELGWRRHHYPERNFSVAWHIRESRLEHLALAQERWTEPRLGARELLDELLAAHSQLAGQQWLEPADAVSRVRYHRIAALARALGLPAPAALVRGEFLRGVLSAGREVVLEEITRQRAGTLGAERRMQAAPAVLFRHLFEYRADVERVVRATGGWLECGDPALLGMIAVQNRLGSQLSEMMADVDRWLVALLDPSDQMFTLGALVAQHGWPDVDLTELEKEAW